MRMHTTRLGVNNCLKNDCRQLSTGPSATSSRRPMSAATMRGRVRWMLRGGRRAPLGGPGGGRGGGGGGGPGVRAGPPVGGGGGGGAGGPTGGDQGAGTTPNPNRKTGWGGRPGRAGN